MIDFSPLWVTMKEKNITQYQLIKSGIDNKTLDSLRKKKISLWPHWKACAGSWAARPTMSSVLWMSQHRKRIPKLRNTVSKPLSLSIPLW